MSLPVQTPLGINLLGGLLQNTGITNQTAFRTLIGTSTGLGNYTAGTLVNNAIPLARANSVLDLAAAVIGNNAVTNVTSATYDQLLTMGAGNLPALTDSAGAFANNFQITSTVTTAAGVIQVNTTDFFAVLAPVYFFGPTLDPAITAGTVYWVASIPSANTITISLTPGGPVLPLTGGNAYDMRIVSVDWLRHGWLGSLAYQAQQSWSSSVGSNLANFCYQFGAISSWINSTNATITSSANSVDFGEFVYSNINDLITADVSGVSLSMTQFGQDLINLGRAMSLSYIQSFGLPHNLLLTLSANRAQTDTVNLALLAEGLTTQEIKNIQQQPQNTNIGVQQRLYQAFQEIRGGPLQEILLLLNCRTSGIRSLADLLDPRYLFPLSYRSLTVPIWNTEPNPTNSKTYYPIYLGTGVNPSLGGNNIRSLVGYIVPNTLSATALARSGSNTFNDLVPGFDSYLREILPTDIATACGAFSYSMQQIAGIENQDIQKFAQVVANLEVSRDLPLIAGTSVPVDVALATTVKNALALGTGPNGTYTFADFFGTITGTNYFLNTTAADVNTLNTTNLVAIYDNMIAVLSAPPSVAGYNSDLAPLILAANTEIATLAAVNPSLTTRINQPWSQAVNNLSSEIAARLRISADILDLTATVVSTPDTQISFVNDINTYAVQTTPNMAAQTLEQLSDLTTVAGQSLVGIMRMYRNVARLDLVGMELNAYAAAQPTAQQTALQIANNPANTDAKPLGQIVENKYIVTNTNYAAPREILDGSAVSGSFGGSPYTELIPPELNSLYTSSQLKASTYSVEEAVIEVEKCNCTCWSP